MTRNRPPDFNPVGAVAPQALNFNFGTTTAAGGSGLDGVTQFAADSVMTLIRQDTDGSGDAFVIFQATAVGQG